MPEETTHPFHSFSFTLIEGTRPRAAFRMKALEGGMYELHVERGSASRPSSQFTREVPLATAQGLKDALQELGVFTWDESYPDAPGLPARRWTLTTVFKEGVFSVSSKGGSDVPVGFELMLEELYRLDFPRPEQSRVGKPAPAAAARPDFGALGDLSNSDMSELQSLAAERQRNPQAMQQRMKDEFRHMSPDEQNQLLDMLSSTGMASRAWWERFFRGF